MVGIVETKKTFVEISELVADAIALAHGGFSSIGKIWEILGDVKELAASAPKALPELADIDQAEAAELAAVAYQCVKKIIEAVQGK